jgi:hypothetical protein
MAADDTFGFIKVLVDEQAKRQVQSTAFTPALNISSFLPRQARDHHERRRDEDCSAVSSASEADALNSAVWVADVCHARRELGRILMLVDVHELPGLLKGFDELPRLFVLL